MPQQEHILDRLGPPPRVIPWGVRWQMVLGNQPTRVFLPIVLALLAGVCIDMRFSRMCDYTYMVWRHLPHRVAQGRITEVNALDSGLTERIRYTYRTPGGRTCRSVSFRNTAFPHRWKELHLDDRIRVEYVAVAPLLNRVPGFAPSRWDGRDSSNGLLFFLLFPSALCLLCVYAGKYSVDLLKNYHVALGKQIKKEFVNIHKSHNCYEYTYEYCVEDGTIRTIWYSTDSENDELNNCILLPVLYGKKSSKDVLFLPSRLDQFGLSIDESGEIRSDIQLQNAVLLPGILLGIIVISLLA